MSLNMYQLHLFLYSPLKTQTYWQVATAITKPMFSARFLKLNLFFEIAGKLTDGVKFFSFYR